MSLDLLRMVCAGIGVGDLSIVTYVILMVKENLLASQLHLII